MRPVFIQTEYVDFEGRIIPDLGELNEITALTGPGIFSTSWFTGINRHHFTFKDIGVIDEDTWFMGSGDAEIVGALAVVGIFGNRVHVKPAGPARQRFIDANVKEIKVVGTGVHAGFEPPVVYSGEDPITVGLDGDAVEGEEYETLRMIRIKRGPK